MLLVNNRTNITLSNNLNSPKVGFSRRTLPLTDIGR